MTTHRQPPERGEGSINLECPNQSTYTFRPRFSTVYDSDFLHPSAAALKNGLGEGWKDFLLLYTHHFKLFMPLHQCTQPIGTATLDIAKNNFSQAAAVCLEQRT